MDASSIPKEYGGELEWTWGDLPLLDEPARQVAGGLELPGENRPGWTRGPILFKGDHIEVLGTENGQPRRITIPVTKPEASNEATEATPQEVEKTVTNGDQEATTEVASQSSTTDQNEKVSSLKTADEPAVPVSNDTAVA
jgi:hypothetical protein